MSSFRELLRVLGAVFIEEGWYYLALVLVPIAVPAAAIWVYRKIRRSKHPTTHPDKDFPLSVTRMPKLLWRVTSLESRAVNTTHSTLDGESRPSYQSTEGDQPLPNQNTQGGLIPEIRLEHTIARLQDMALSDPPVPFRSDRLKSEVLKPMYQYLTELTQRLSTLPMLTCRLVLEGSGTAANGEPWQEFYGDKTFIDEVPKQALRLDITFRLSFKLMRGLKQEYKTIYVKGHFASDYQGSWVVGGQRTSAATHDRELYMYNWFELKQRISNIVEGVLVGLLE